MRLLVIEDSPSDWALLSRVLAHQFPELDVHREVDGLGARDYLYDCVENRRLPRLVLLDIGLPGLSGDELLREINDTQALRSIYVAVMASSATSIEILRKRGVKPQVFVEKPIDNATLTGLLKDSGIL